MSDYVSSADSKFDEWQDNFVRWSADKGGTHGLSSTLLEKIAEEQAGWNADYANHLDAQVASGAATKQKDARRESFEGLLRQAAQILQVSPAMSDTMRKEAGITVPKSGPRTPAVAPRTHPVLVIDTSKRLAHRIDFRDADNSVSRRKPKGAAGVQLYLFVGGDAPPDVDAMEFVAFDSATPYIYEFEAADAGKNAWWAARWVNSRQEPGPWSETVMATIAG